MSGEMLPEGLAEAFKQDMINIATTIDQAMNKVCDYDGKVVEMRTDDGHLVLIQRCPARDG